MCPCCGSYDNTLVGTLGNLVWLRCRDCGAESSQQAEEEEEDYDDIAVGCVGFSDISWRLG